MEQNLLAIYQINNPAASGSSSQSRSLAPIEPLNVMAEMQALDTQEDFEEKLYALIV